MIFSLFFITALAVYLLFAIGSVHPGKLKNAIFFLLLFLAAASGSLLSVLYPAAPYIGWCILGLLLFGFDLFYDEEGLLHQWPYLAALWLGSLLLLLTGTVLLLPALLCLVLAVYRRELKQPVSYIKLLLLTVLALLPLSLPLRGALLLLLLAALELTRHGYQANFERSTRAFQQRVLMQQYDEIKQMYLDMRGWRHDYHSHIQSIKAYLALGQLPQAQAYLEELDADLSHVEQYIRSGHLMVDAILNSKLSLAEKALIRVDCTAQLPEQLALSDVDLCVLLGNLLDNAIEACEQIEPDARFLRVYMTVHKKQLYLSVQNAAKEILNFNERHYITSKRGHHGLGMLRVKLLVDKYEGYLNLQNEPGIFAAEVTLPNP